MAASFIPRGHERAVQVVAQLDPQKVVVKLEVNNPDLSRVDEIGYVDLMPGGGHGTAGCTNVSWIEVYATAHKR